MNAENYCCKMHEHVILNERVKKEIVMVTMDEIVAQIGPTAEIIERIRPVYNFKAAD